MCTGRGWAAFILLQGRHFVWLSNCRLLKRDSAPVSVTIARDGWLFREVTSDNVFIRSEWFTLKVKMNFVCLTQPRLDKLVVSEQFAHLTSSQSFHSFRRLILSPSSVTFCCNKITWRSSAPVQTRRKHRDSHV
jgi:hypothetical protein